MEVEQVEVEPRALHADPAEGPEHTFLDAEQGPVRFPMPCEQLVVTSTPRAALSERCHVSSEDDMDDFGGHRVPVFDRFTYDEIGAFKREALNAAQRHRRRWRMARGIVPVVDMLDILDSFPVPDSRCDQWHLDKRERLIPHATIWNHNQQMGTDGPTPLCGEYLLDYY